MQDVSREFNLMGIHNYGDLLKRLQAGAKFCSVMELRDGTKTLNTHVWADDKYIYWHYYGSSANDATLRDLEFVVTKIFEMTLDEFIRAFICV